MTKSIKISDEDYYLVEIIKNQEDWTFTKTLSKAINYFAKVKRMTPWDKLSKDKQDEIKNKAKKILTSN
jgi:hypothetical protein